MGRPTCATCAAFHPFASGKNWGQCRRYPPRPFVEGGRAQFPSVAPGEWCFMHIVPPDDNPFPQAPICVQCGVDRAEYVGGGRYGTKCQSCAEMALGAAERVGANEANMRKLIAEHLRWPTSQQTTQGPKPETPAAPAPSPEPDPQGL